MSQLAEAEATGLIPDDDRAALAPEQSNIGEVSQTRLMLRRFKRSKLAVVSVIILGLMYLGAVFAPFLSPNDPAAVDADYKFSKPSQLTFSGGGPGICRVSQKIDPINIRTIYTTDCNNAIPLHFFGKGFEYKLLGIIPTDRHLVTVNEGKLLLFGADSQGRDIMSRMIFGSRVSMTIGVLGVLIATVLGSIIGTISGYIRGATDTIIQRFIEIVMSIPQLPLWATMAAVLPQNMSVTKRYLLMTLILSLVTWTGLARQVRGKVMSYASADYVNAARSAGSSDTRIVLTHLVPNAASHIVAVSMLAVPAAILAETALSFLGIGMLDPAISWGVLLQDASKIDVLQQYPWVLIPALAVILCITCFQLLGDGVRDAVDPYS
ncbi:ABC transporter permease [Microlunatus sp. Gsoil 973]|jgi:peptide/nickel transport system permease protein|uniref:ABC transporter permease n=1 Tax=Microlunatus sp. Gsoil 973 TaxID=2672569 RepID=UPI0012B45703|nr:ABC transporter permease [Microlunatus sp. Gsoil 973]QGN32767.1 ABC transporter permease subunit [Microlunatus sp. Gsoil 973]